MYIDLHPPALVAAEPADTFETVMASPQNRVEYAYHNANAELKNLHAVLLAAGPEYRRAAAAVAGIGFALADTDLTPDVVPAAMPADDWFFCEGRR